MFMIERENRGVPEYIRVWAAVMRRAAVDWVLYAKHDNPRMRKHGHDAYVWLFLDNDSGYISTFQSVCEILGLDAELVRNRIRALTEDEVRRMRCMEFGDDH